jgi:hypothetical protein
VVEDFWYARIFPDGSNGRRASHVEVSVRIGIDGELHDEFAVLHIVGQFWGNVELLHGADESFGAVNDVLVDGMSVQAQFVDAVAVLVDDFHLFDNGRLAALAGACVGVCQWTTTTKMTTKRTKTYLAAGSCILAAASSSPLQARGQWLDSSS